MTSNLSLEDLTIYAKDFAKIHWNREFNVKIELVNYAWKRVLGVYIVRKDGQLIIRMSKVSNDRMPESMVLGTLRHEMVHWHLHTTGQPFSDESPLFVEECILVGAPFSGTKSAQNECPR